MKKLNRLVLPAAVLFFFAGLISVIGVVNDASAQELLPENQEQEQSENQGQQNTEQNQEGDAQQNTEEGSAEAQQEENDESTEDVYTYVAQSGDSYTLMARKAVQTYGLNNEVNLSEAQIIFAETNLTQAADSPRLNVGQEVQIKQSLVKEWVEKAQQLSEEQQADWAAYTAGVDFNTNSVGEAS